MTRHEQEIQQIQKLTSWCTGHGREHCGSRKCQRAMERERLELLAKKGEKPPPDVAAALVTFAAWLTTRRETLVIGAVHDASRMAQLVEEFRIANDIEEPVMETAPWRHP